MKNFRVEPRHSSHVTSCVPKTEYCQGISVGFEKHAFSLPKSAPYFGPKALTKKRIGVRDPKREMRGGFFGVLLTVLSIWDTGHKQKNVKPPTIC